MGNIPFAVTEEELGKVFSAAGRVVNVYMPRKRSTGGPSGCGFVTFENERDADRAVYEFVALLT